jgi:hypothetical protein
LPRDTVVHVPERPAARTAAVISSRWVRMFPKCSTTCPPVSGSFAMFGRSWPAAAATPSFRPRRPAGRLPEAWPGPACSPMCWWPNTAITCRFTGRAASMPGKALIWNARPWPTGWGNVQRCCARWLNGCVTRAGREAACRRYAGAGPRPGRWQDQDRAVVDLCPR